MISGFFIGFYNIESNFILYPITSFASIIISFIAFIAPFKCNKEIKSKTHSLFKSLNNVMHLILKKQVITYLACALLMMISQLSYSAYMPVYLAQMGFSAPSILMQIAVLSELIFMLCLSSIMKIIKVESLMLIGALAYALRSLITINIHDASPFLIIVALILHGISWVFFFIAFDIFIKKYLVTTTSIKCKALRLF